MPRLEDRTDLAKIPKNEISAMLSSLLNKRKRGPKHDTSSVRPAIWIVIVGSRCWYSTSTLNPLQYHSKGIRHRRLCSQESRLRLPKLRPRFQPLLLLLPLPLPLSLRPLPLHNNPHLGLQVCNGNDQDPESSARTLWSRMLSPSLPCLLCPERCPTNSVMPLHPA